MASTPEGRRLTEEHRRAQLALRAQFMQQFLALWPLLDPQRLDETSPGWVLAVMGLLRPYRRRSADISTNYFVEYRQVEAPSPGRPGPRPTRSPDESAQPTQRPSPASRPAPTPRPPSPARSAPRVTPTDRRVRIELPELADGPRERVRIDIPEIDWTSSDRAAVVSLNVTGPVSQKSKAARGKPPQQARDESFVEAAGAASRHMLTGGRQSLLTLIEDDRQAIAWIRVTDGDPCAFCAMLASRGPVFQTASFADSDKLFEGPGNVKVHDNCACTMEPVYNRNAPWPGRSAEFRRLWEEVVGFAPNNRYSGQDAINAFRREYERRQRAGRRVEVA